MSGRRELSAFLQAQRAHLSLDQVGLTPNAVPRRVPGLRREEVAALAGVSTDYYTRLEQGRKLAPSDSVLNAIARALQLDDVARQHLFDIARPEAKPREVDVVQRVRPITRQLIESWNDQPAFILGRRREVLASNSIARALIFDFRTLPVGERNYIRWVLLHPDARTLYRDWAKVASEMVAVLRLEVGRFPDDHLLSHLVSELAVKCPEFPGWWADHRVSAHTHGRKRFRHQIVGDLELDWQGLVLPGDESQRISVYFAPPGSPAAEKLALLASWAAPERSAVAESTRQAGSRADDSTGSVGSDVA